MSAIRHDDDFGDDPESEEDEANPYPLEGKYADELDRQRCVLDPFDSYLRSMLSGVYTRLLDMPETEREDILSQRLEEMQRFQDRVNLDKMLKAQKGSPEDQMHSDSVAKAAKRENNIFTREPRF